MRFVLFHRTRLRSLPYRQFMQFTRTLPVHAVPFVPLRHLSYLFILVVRLLPFPFVLPRWLKDTHTLLVTFYRLIGCSLIYYISMRVYFLPFVLLWFARARLLSTTGPHHTFYFYWWCPRGPSTHLRWWDPAWRRDLLFVHLLHVWNTFYAEHALRYTYAGTAPYPGIVVATAGARHYARTL